MKASDILKKVEYIGAAEIQIVFKEEKEDPARDMVFITEETTEESKEQIIKRASGYTVQEINIFKNILTLYAVRTAKRTPKLKPDKVQEEKREEQKQAIAEELERLDQAVAVLIETIVAPFRRIGQRENGKRGGILAALKNARAAVRRILTRIFRKGE